MEFDILNDLITGVVGRFFSFDGPSLYPDNYSKQNPSISSSSAAANRSSNPISTTSSQQSSRQASNASIIRTSAQQPSQPDTTASTTASNSRRAVTTQQNNLFEGSSSNQIMTPELWIQREGPNKLKEAQIRLNLNLQRLSRTDLEAMTLDQLIHEKKRVKTELKMYDAAFNSHFHRLPQKHEKEPLRQLYLYYKKLKQYMAQKGQPGSQNEINDGDEPSSASQRPAQQRASGTSAASAAAAGSSGPTSQGLNSQQVALMNQIEELKRIRADLRERLHTYQNDFFRNHNRRIRYHQDIRPVEAQYKQYKDTKAELARLEGLLNINGGPAAAGSN